MSAVRRSTINVFSDFVGPMPCGVCDTQVVRAQVIDGRDITLNTAAPEILKREPCPEGCRHDILTIPLTAVHLCPQPKASQDQAGVEEMALA